MILIIFLSDSLPSSIIAALAGSVGLNLDLGSGLSFQVPVWSPYRALLGFRSVGGNTTHPSRQLPVEMDPAGRPGQTGG